MKTMTCEQLGGACDMQFHADTFEEMADLSQAHGKEMVDDEAHAQAMSDMSELMKNPEAMNEWFEGKKQEFDALPEDSA